ncbi:response regulator transcription factor [Iodobacter arcticus]|uniref:Response regulator transcription factor n=1 Tax=Iodobacter arcticus TaxID=590593 RepID=A0ABW2R0C3_9NEIS|nr:response regulator [Janthinobacterium sp. B9-8]AMC33748.1 two-component system response regulator [Janthinobacterium sp. B9-8]
MRPIAVIDDDSAVRDALQILFEAHQWPVFGFESAEHFLKESDAAEYSCLIIDVRMTGMSGLELYAELKTSFYLPPVIFLTGHADVPMAVAAVKDGVMDFLEKPCDYGLLVSRIEACLARDEEARSAWTARQSLDERLESLTPREREVLRELLTGRLNKQIADELDISIKTVEVHRARIYTKLKVRSAGGLAASLKGVQISEI